MCMGLTYVGFSTLQCRKGKDLYPNGRLKFLVNSINIYAYLICGYSVHTMEELKLTENHLKGHVLC